MKKSALELNGVTKHYKDFKLENISFSVPQGTIVGLIGENGAGKSTILKTILGLIQKDTGSINILGKQEKEIDFTTRNQIGVVFDGNNIPENSTPKYLNGLFKNIYLEWDEKKYFSLLKKLSLPTNKKISTFSKGMKTKLSIVVAFSHNSHLLILDEVTSGLDPVIRDDILDMLLDYIQDENNSILVSSHITSDLEKIADYIVFIHDGKILFNELKDTLTNEYGIIKCGANQFETIDKNIMLAYRKHDYEYEILVSNRNIAQKNYPHAIIIPASIDDIMLIYLKGEKL